MFTQVLVYTCLIDNDIQLSWLQLLSGSFATALMAGAGNIINDIFDLDADKINKGDKVVIENKISKSNAWLLYYTLNAISFIVAITICYQIDDYLPLTAVLFIIISLWWYSYSLKRLALFGNLMVALLSAMAILVVALYEGQWDIQLSFYFAFAFILSLQREIIKDIEDVDGDKVIEARTLPIKYGVSLSKWIANSSAFVLFGFLIYFINLSDNVFLKGYLSVLIGLPLIYLIYKTIKAEQSSDYHKISQLIKLLMVVGICSMLFFL